LEELKLEYQDYEKRKWVNIGQKVGMSPSGCKNAIREMGFDV
jgi:hypothetical protein